MIIHRFQRRKRKEQYSLPGGHEGQRMGYGCAQCIKQEPFEPMVIECTESVRHVKPVMDGMEMPIKVLIRMEQSVEEVLPGVHDYQREEELANWN